MDRTVPFDEEEICDICGETGAYDFMGDLICGNCIDTLKQERGDKDASKKIND